MIRFLSSFVQSRWYWLAVIFVGLAMEGVALFYQYGLGEPPCGLCIQSRAWTLLGVLFAVFGVIANRLVALRYIAHAGLLVSVGFLWKVSREVVLVERGIIESSCGMDAGFPAWLPLQKLVPQVFEVWTMCSFTPNFLFGLSMGEGLLYGVIVLFFIAVAALVIQLLKSFGVIRV
jgi:disulfide bond formation protein DsbB